MMPEFLRGIPASNTWVSVEKVQKGWSKEQKFHAIDRHGGHFLIRVTEVANLRAKEVEFEVMQKIASMGISMSQPVDFGVCGEFVYSIFSWVDGVAFDDSISGLSTSEQYELGGKAGEILKRMHSVSAPTDLEPWGPHMRGKIAKYIKRYGDCGIKISQDERMLKFISENIHLLDGRPRCFQHGDFHVGNLILLPSRDVGVIDFNRWDYGDPWEEFYKMCMFSREKSIPFSVGQLHGYFGGDIPEQFFRLLSLYLAGALLSSVAWAMPFGDFEVEKMIRLSNFVLEDLDDLRECVPRWLREWKNPLA